MAISRRLARETAELSFGPPVACVYRPLEYAHRSHELYLRRYARPRPDVLLVGMNPGPFGMAQTGVPFGEVGLVRDWLGIETPVERPAHEHPERPVEGFACGRSEVSGRRLWGWARERFGTPERFFRRFFVWNYCPLSFLEESGRNRTPDKLPADERRALFAPCDRALLAIARRLRPSLAVGIGAFAAARIGDALAPLELPTGQILHPSPASPAANRGWAEAAERQLAELGVDVEGRRRHGAG